jgi:hypothetical protein
LLQVCRVGEGLRTQYDRLRPSFAPLVLTPSDAPSAPSAPPPAAAAVAAAVALPPPPRQAALAEAFSDEDAFAQAAPPNKLAPRAHNAAAVEAALTYATTFQVANKPAGSRLRLAKPK